MFGCSDAWIGRRFGAGLTRFLAGERQRRELCAHDATSADELQRRYEAFRDGNPGADDAPLVPTWTPHAGTPPAPPPGGPYPWTTTTQPMPLGREHEIPSNAETVALGVFDPSRAPVATVESGDVLVYRDTWTHFLGKLQPGLSIGELAALRRAHPGRGVHSIVGPVAVRGARPGDLLELRMLELRTIGFGANFHNPDEIGTGVLPREFHDGHVHYFELDADAGFVTFNERIRLALRPFQGTIGVAAAGNEAISSVAPGNFAGNIDLKELTAGSSLFVPVFHEGALIFTGDSHALQGDGEVNITALETAMELVKIQVILHPRQATAFPMAETPTHWIALGIDADLDEALRIALRGTIDFLALRAGLTRDEAYSLASLAVDFRVTQMVDINSGVHAMIPKEIFADDYRTTIRVA